MSSKEKEKKPNVFKESLKEVKEYFKDFRFDKKHMLMALPFFIEMILFVFIIVLDLTMKNYLYQFVEIENGGHFVAIEGFLDLTYSENTGIGFGLAQNSTVGVSIITCILLVVIIGYLCVYRKDKLYIRIPLVMVAGGGIANLVDRIALGYVRDFFEFTFVDFAIFNIADVFVTVGAIALIIGLIVMMVITAKEEKTRQEDEKASAGAKEATSNDETALTSAIAENANDEDIEQSIADDAQTEEGNFKIEAIDSGEEVSK